MPCPWPLDPQGPWHLLDLNRLSDGSSGTGCPTHIGTHTFLPTSRMCDDRWLSLRHYQTALKIMGKGSKAKLFFSLAKKCDMIISQRWKRDYDKLWREYLLVDWWRVPCITNLPLLLIILNVVSMQKCLTAVFKNRLKLCYITSTQILSVSGENLKNPAAVNEFLPNFSNKTISPFSLQYASI